MDNITKKLVETIHQIVEGDDSFGSGYVPSPSAIEDEKRRQTTPELMTDDELDAASAFGSGPENVYRDELRRRYGPKGRPPRGTPLPPPPPPHMPEYLKGKTDTAEYPELHIVHGYPAPTELDKLRYLHKVRPDLAP